VTIKEAAVNGLILGGALLLTNFVISLAILFLAFSFFV
jgi:hypothetical protein